MRSNRLWMAIMPRLRAAIERSGRRTKLTTLLPGAPVLGYALLLENLRAGRSSRSSESASRGSGCTGGFCIERFHKIQDHVSDALITGCRIDHGMVSGAVRPVDAEVFLDEFDAVVIDGIDALLRILLGFAARYEAAHFIFPGSVEKDAERVRTIP